MKQFCGLIGMMPRSPEVEEKLSQYCALIRKFHKTLDLMSAKGLVQLDQKLDDAFSYAEALAPHLTHTDSACVLDVGSGVGLPAIPLALAYPDHNIMLVERRQRRASFLKIVVSQLALDNAQVWAQDVEQLTPEDTGAVSLITAQAVGSFALLYRLTQHLHHRPITLISRKGNAWETERYVLEAEFNLTLQQVQQYPLTENGTLIAVTL